MKNIKDLTADDRAAQWLEIATLIDENFTEVNNKPGNVDPESNGTGEIFNSNSNKASGNYSHAEGNSTIASGSTSHAEGYNTTASGSNSHAEGNGTIASGTASHAEGYNTSASGSTSHAEGNNTTASGNYSHAEGQNTTAGGSYSHAEGNSTIASGSNSHAEGQNTTAGGSNSHAEGNGTTASGTASHAEGYGALASGQFTHASNRGAVADNYAQTSIGYFNEIDSNASPTAYRNTKPAFLIGNGQNDNARGNAFKVLFNGQTYADGEYSNAGADYAECFEWEDGNPTNDDRVGLFVSLNNDKIQLADENSNYILGVVSGAPTIIGDNPMRWHNKYLNDKWGRPIYEDIEVIYKEFEKQKNGTEIEVEKTRIDHVRKINPNFNPNEKYIPRSERPEWDYIGMMGKLLVKQDGTLVAGGFCKPINGGLATKSENGYYVMKVIDDEQALILLK